MNFKWGAAAALCLIASIIAGCATGGRVTVFGEGKKGDCEWTSQSALHDKIVKGSLKLTKGQDKCKVEEFGSPEKPLYIGDDKNKLFKVLDIEGAMVTEGACRYCYANTGGGISCVWLPSC